MPRCCLSYTCADASAGWKVILTHKVPAITATGAPPVFAGLVPRIAGLPSGAGEYDWALHPGGAKVLTAEEVRNWRGDDNETETRSVLAADASPSSSRPLTPSRVAVPEGDDGLGSEDEVEATLDEPDSQPPAPLPPITITPSASP